MSIDEFVKDVRKMKPHSTLEQILTVWAFQLMKTVKRENFYSGLDYENRQMQYIADTLEYYKESLDSNKGTP